MLIQHKSHSSLFQILNVCANLLRWDMKDNLLTVETRIESFSVVIVACIQ